MVKGDDLKCQRRSLSSGFLSPFDDYYIGDAKVILTELNIVRFYRINIEVGLGHFQTMFLEMNPGIRGDDQRNKTSTFNSGGGGECTVVPRIF